MKTCLLIFAEASMSSPESPNKKRKPGRPKKCDLIRPGVTGIQHIAMPRNFDNKSYVRSQIFMTV